MVHDGKPDIPDLHVGEQRDKKHQNYREEYGHNRHETVAVELFRLFLYQISEC